MSAILPEQAFAMALDYEAVAKPDAPPLPVEKHVVAAALAAERMKGLCEQIALVLQHAPRDVAMLKRVHGEALDAWLMIDEHYSAYQAVLSCEGQA